MGILKIKDWAKSKSGKQFIVKEQEAGGQIISVERIVDKTSFRLDEVVLCRAHTNFQGKELDIFVTINQFFKDEINVELRCEAYNYPLSRRIGITNINNLKEYSFNLAENLVKEMDESFKKRLSELNKYKKTTS